MIESLFLEHIKERYPKNALEQELIIKELLQSMILGCLSRGKLFEEAVFHGGTCLRLIFHLNRFSEDLDFILKKSNPNFKWSKYLNLLKKELNLEGIHLEIMDKSDVNTAVKKTFLKTDSIGKILLLKLPFTRMASQKIIIKLEIDTNPPIGSIYETRYIYFPQLAPVSIQTLESGFGMKSHALLCRRYIKGRDWYDFIWYISKVIRPDLDLLSNALKQQGPWANKNLKITTKWYIHALHEKISSINWVTAKNDVKRFIPMRDSSGIELWNVDFFLHHINKLEQYMI